MIAGDILCKSVQIKIAKGSCFKKKEGGGGDETCICTFFASFFSNARKSHTCTHFIYSKMHE